MRVPSAVGLVAAMSSLWMAPAASAQDDAEQQLAQRYAPVVRLQAVSDDCGQGEPFVPTDVDAVLGDQQVALRGPWTNADLVAVGPTSDQLSKGLPGYFMDFPGNPLSPGCTYADWSSRINAGRQPTVYAHVAKDAARPDQLSLQYWFFYVFNDYNNKHEGDWESIQLVFPAPSAEAALDTSPVSVGYSQHGGAERALWGDDKLQVVDETHPVVYPAAGSHANHFETDLFLGRGSDGLGCDDTTDPTDPVTPAVQVIPSSDEQAASEYPWLAFEGRWGERQKAFYNGPTGPSMKSSWTQPIRFAEDTWRDGSTAVPAGGSLGPNVTGAFCQAVATGSNIARVALDNPWVLALVVAVLAAIIWFAGSRTRWEAEAFPVRARRGWGQAIVSAFDLYRREPLLFVVFGLILLPFTVANALVTRFALSEPQQTSVTGPSGDDHSSWWQLFATLSAVADVAAYVGLVATVIWAVTRLDAGDRPSLRESLVHLRAKALPLIVVTVWYVAVIVVLAIFVVTVPLAIYYAVSRAYAVPAVVADDLGPRAALRRSRELVRDHWWSTFGSLLVVVVLGASLAPVLGIGLLLFTELPLGVINVLAGLVYMASLPLVVLAYSYLYFDRLTATHTTPAAAPAPSTDRPPAFAM